MFSVLILNNGGNKEGRKEGWTEGRKFYLIQINMHKLSYENKLIMLRNKTCPRKEMTILHHK